MESSEDQLFKKLKRTPFNEVVRLWSEYLLPHPIYDYNFIVVRDMRQFLEPHGWTREEYFSELQKK